jgi:hypothetical protein
MSSHLYELAGKYRELARLADDPDMPPEALADTLEGIEGEIQVKAENLTKFLANLDANEAVLDAEIKRLQKRLKGVRGRREWLRNYLRQNMEVTGIQKISCELFVISLGKGRPLAVIDDEAALPSKYVTEKRTTIVDRVALLEDLKAGVRVPGAHLGDTEPSLRIT